MQMLVLEFKSSINRSSTCMQSSFNDAIFGFTYPRFQSTMEANLDGCTMHFDSAEDMLTECKSLKGLMLGFGFWVLIMNSLELSHGRTFSFIHFAIVSFLMFMSSQWNSESKKKSEWLTGLSSFRFFCVPKAIPCNNPEKTLICQCLGFD